MSVAQYNTHETPGLCLVISRRTANMHDLPASLAETSGGGGGGLFIAKEGARRGQAPSRITNAQRSAPSAGPYDPAVHMDGWTDASACASADIKGTLLFVDERAHDV